MKVALRKVTSSPLDFEINFNQTVFKGYLQYHRGKLIFLKARLSGFIQIECDVCAQEIDLAVDEQIELFISDGIYEEEHNGVDLDVVESLNSIADLDELLNSEIELIKSDYYSCESCKNKSE